MIKAIVFDYDGVIVDSFVSVFEVYKKICKRFNVECPKDIEGFRLAYGFNYIECLKNLGIKEDDFKEASSIYREEIAKMEHDIFDDIVDVLKELAEKYRLYLASASYSDEVVSKMEKFGLAGYFEKVCSKENDNDHKSEMIGDLMHEHGYSSDEVIGIGDRAIDYEIMKKVGLSDENMIMADYGWGLDKGKIGDARVASNPKEILSLVYEIDRDSR